MKLLAFKRHITFEIPVILLPSVMDTNISECSRYYSIQSTDQICKDDPPYRDAVWGSGCKLPAFFLKIRHDKKVCG